MTKKKKAVVVPKVELPEVEKKAVLTEEDNRIFVTNGTENREDYDIFIKANGEQINNVKLFEGLIVICIEGDALFSAQSMNKCEFVIRELLRILPDIKSIDGDAKYGMKQFKRLLI